MVLGSSNVQAGEGGERHNCCLIFYVTSSTFLPIYIIEARNWLHKILQNWKCKRPYNKFDFLQAAATVFFLRFHLYKSYSTSRTFVLAPMHYFYLYPTLHFGSLGYLIFGFKVIPANLDQSEKYLVLQMQPV